ncbi:uncharacterized protein [Procambarus clarkii]|uniref:uncharacterized protein n=1 Tax=Procambarus clarkii TaxID=6728 RepID=UPI003743A736
MIEDELDPPVHKLWNLDTLGIVPEYPRPDNTWVKSVKSDTDKLTMRKLLSQVSKPFDPLGLVSPILIMGKLLMQECWESKISWDDPLPLLLLKRWQQLTIDLSILNNLKFPRNTVKHDQPVKLHVFCDVSRKVYDMVANLVTNEEATLLKSKARVAP